MKKITLLVVALLTTVMTSFGQIWSEDFESYADGTGIAGNATTTPDNIGDYPLTNGKWILTAESPEKLQASTDWAKTVNGALNFQDAEGTIAWETEAINISTASNPVNFQLTVSNNTGGFETSDYLDVYYSIDGGDYNLISNWANLGDESHTILGEKEGIDWSTEETIQVNALTGKTLKIKVVVLNNASKEQFFLDNIIVSDENITLPATIKITSPAAGTIFPTGTTNVDVVFEIENATGSETVDITVNGTKTFGVTSPFTVTTTDGEAYTITLDLVDFIIDDGSTIINSKTTDFKVSAPSSVANLSELRNASQDGTIHTLTGEVIVTGIVNDTSVATRNQMFIQDESAAILIDDKAGVLVNFNLEEGDKIIGLTGILSDYFGTIQFTPDASSNVTIVSKGNTVNVQEVTIAELRDNGENYESELIKVLNAQFTGITEGQNFADSTNYIINDSDNNEATSTCRVRFDGIANELPGTAIPTTTVSITGFGGEFKGTYQVYPRTTADIQEGTLSITKNNSVTFKAYPNPVNTMLNIAAKGVVNVSVYNTMGQKVLATTKKTINVAALTSGIYFVEVAQQGASSTKKIIVE